MEAPEVQPGSGAMFDRIAHRYDLLNRLMSMGLDRGWRRKLITRATAGLGHDELIDVASGTADVAIALARHNEAVRVIGVDPSAQMLEVGRKKVADRGLADRVELVVGDGQALPYADDRFAAATISFGIRNVPDRQLGLSEMRRVVRPGGKVLVLELSEPSGPAKFYVHHVVPTMGALLSGQKEYRYLQKSIAEFPSPDQFAELMRLAGLEDVVYERMTMGVAHLFEGRVPARP